MDSRAGLKTAEDYFIRKIEDLEARLKGSKKRIKELEEAIDIHRQVHDQGRFAAPPLEINGWDRDLWSVVPKPKQQAEAEREARRELND